MNKLKDIALKVDMRNNYSKEMYGKPDTDSFCFDDYLNETIEMSKANGYEDGLIYGVIISAIRQMAFGNYDKGLEILNKLIEEKPLDQFSLKNRMKYYSCLGSYYSDFVGDLEMAVKCASIELEIAYSLDDINEIMLIKMNIGALNTYLKFYDTAAEFLNESLDYYDSTQKWDLLAYNYLHLGELYLEKEEYTIAKECFKKSVTLALQEHVVIIIHYSNIGLAKIEKVFKNYNLAIKYLEEAINITREIASFQEEVEVRLELIDIYLLRKYYDLALEELKFIQDGIRDLKNNKMLKTFYKYKAEVCYRLEHKDSAYKSLLEYIRISEEENNTTSQLAMNNIIQEEHEKALKRLETIAAVGRELTVLSNIDDVILNIKKELSKVLPVDSIGVGELEDGLLLFNHYYINEEKTEFHSVLLDDDRSLAAWCVRNEEELVINDLSNEYNQYIKETSSLEDIDDNDYRRINSLMYAPLKVDDKIIGVFTIQSCDKNVYSSIEINIFQIIVDYVAISLVNIARKKELESLSVRDNLTNMYNRRGFIDYYNDYINQGSYSSVSIVMLDLDFFKAINDKDGHIAGDQVLKIVAKTLMDKEEEGICTARLGGEEFGVIVFNKSVQFIEDLAERIRRDIEKLDIILGDIRINITSSIGVTFNKSDEAISYNQLYYEADNALYRAKEAGRNNVKFY